MTILERAATAARATLLGTGLFLAALSLAHAEPSKLEHTPGFWQRDPEADFDNEGRNHCAPVAIGAGLVYLATAQGYDDLVDGTDHDAQIALITDLAEKMETDPAEGTNPDKILNGLRSYAEQRGYSFERLELCSWRGLSAGNKRYKIGSKPRLSWIVAAAEDPEAIAILNFGWYKEEEDGSYTRHGGHWVSVVAARGGGRFDVRNPLLQPRRQRIDTEVTLQPVGDDFIVAQTNGSEFDMTGYYQAEGPGLPFDTNRLSAAVLDSVIVFKLKKE